MQPQFPPNSKRPSRTGEEPKTVERVATGNVVRRKTPLGKRFTRNFIGGDARGVWDYVFDEILVPMTRNMIADAVGGGVQQMLFGHSSHSGRRSASRYGTPGYVAYNRPSAPVGRRDEPRQISHRGRATHSFDEIILERRVEAEEVLDRLEDFIAKYDSVSVATLYDMLGVSSNYVDQNWGWTDLRTASVSHVRNGYLLNLPKPEQID